jgi:hypothetical protein
VFKVLEPALTALRIPYGQNIKDATDPPVNVSFLDSECWNVRSQGTLLRLRYYPDDPPDFTYKYRGLNAIMAQQWNMNTTFKVIGTTPEQMCGRYAFKRQILPGNVSKYAAYRAFKPTKAQNEICINQVLDEIKSGALSNASDWAHFFPGLGFATNDHTPISTLVTAKQRTAVIGGGAAKSGDGCSSSSSKVCLCAVPRDSDGTCPNPSINSVGVKFEVLAWYLQSSGAFVAGELTWDYDGSTTTNADSIAILNLLRRNFTDYIGSGTKTAALYATAAQPLSCLPPSPPFPPGTVYSVVSFTAAGDVTDFSVAQKTSIQSAFVTLLGVDASAVHVKIAPGSVQVTVTIAASSSAALSSTNSVLKTTLKSISATNTFLASSGVTGVTATTAPSVSSSNASKTPSGIAGGVIASIVLPLVLLCTALTTVAYVKLKQAPRTERLMTAHQMEGDVELEYTAKA